MVQQIITLRDMEKYADQLFTGQREAKKAAPILKGILDAQSSRISEIVQHMDGSAESNTKKIHRWLKDGDPDIALMRLYNDDTPYVIVYVTEVKRPQAKRTKYVGVLKDGQTLGFDLLMLATPYRGRALPFHCISYSSRTIAEEKRSRNMEHRLAITDVMSMIGETPLVFDREFRRRERKKETHDHDDLVSSSRQILVQTPFHRYWNRDEELLEIPPLY